MSAQCCSITELTEAELAEAVAPWELELAAGDGVDDGVLTDEAPADPPCDIPPPSGVLTPSDAAFGGSGAALIGAAATVASETVGLEPCRPPLATRMTTVAMAAIATNDAPATPTIRPALCPCPCCGSP